MTVLVYGKAAQTLTEVVESFETSEFDSPLRSTVTLLDYWRNCENAFSIWAKRLELDVTRANWFEFEFAVRPPRGKGKPSFTDLAIATDCNLVAIEAKFLEPPYESCAEWLGDEPSKNRKEVLAGWLDILSSRTGRTIDTSEILYLPYQLIHRAASACSMPRLKPVLIYQIFDSSKRTYYSNILDGIKDVIGKNVVVGLQISHFEPNQNYLQLISRFRSGERKLSSMVIESLKDGPIGNFEDEDLFIFEK
jgi:hypothetical protein